jgi:molybdopterin-guanine dinucleotide biosynthesis protein A
MPLETIDQNTSNLAVVILAGGRGMRLGGRDKALCDLGGVTLLQHCLARLKAQNGPVALSANGDLERFSDFKFPVIPDTLGMDFGPLAGILTAMDWAHTIGHTKVMTIAVDTPFFPQDLAVRLQTASNSHPITLAATRDTDDTLWPHPTFGIWQTGLRYVLRQDLQNGTRKVMTWAKAQGVGLVEFSTRPYDPFFNINTPDDLNQAHALLAKRT